MFYTLLVKMLFMWEGREANMISYHESNYYKELISIFNHNKTFNNKVQLLLNNDNVREISSQYTIKLLNESGPIRRWGSDPENYYFQIAIHCYCSGLCVASWLLGEPDEINVEKAISSLTSDDSTLMIAKIVPIQDDFELTLRENIMFDQFLDYSKNVWNGRLDNKNELIIASMIAFFMRGVTEDLSLLRSQSSNIDETVQNDIEKTTNSKRQKSFKKVKSSLRNLFAKKSKSLTDDNLLPHSEFSTKLRKEVTSICVDAGYLRNNYAVVPELITLGGDYILGKLNNMDLQKKYEKNMEEYYLVISTNIFCSGIVSAFYWKNDFEHFANFKNYLINNEPEKQIPVILGFEVGGKEDNKFKGVLHSLVTKTLDELFPYMALEDPRRHIYNAMMVLFQTGNAIQLNKYK